MAKAGRVLLHSVRCCGHREKRRLTTRHTPLVLLDDLEDPSFDRQLIAHLHLFIQGLYSLAVVGVILLLDDHLERGGSDTRPS